MLKFSDDVYLISSPSRLLNAITVSIVPLLPGEYQLFIYHRGDKFFSGQPINVTGNEIIAEEVVNKVGSRAELFI